MGTTEALAVLGLAAGATFADVRVAYRRLVRQAHPDVAGPGATALTARLTQAYAVLRAEAATLGPDAGLGTADVAPPEPARPGPAASDPPSAAWRAAYDQAVEAELAAGDTLWLRAPAPEAFAALLEAAGEVGDVAYVDRQLGIVEAIVRFEGGPSCSLLITLQGRSHGTEAFCTLESLEAAPAPPIGPVVEALVAALDRPS